MSTRLDGIRNQARTAAPFISGVLTALSFPSARFFPLIWLSLVPLLIATRKDSQRMTFLRFFTAGLVFYLILLQWLLCNVYWAGGWAVWGYGALCLLMAAYWGLLGILCNAIRVLLPAPFFVVFVATAWVGMEYLQGKLFTGFGWGALGYVHTVDLYFLQLAAVGGVGLLSFFTVLVNVLLAQSFVAQGRRWMYAVAVFAVLSSVHFVGWLLLQDADYDSEPFVVGLVQPNFPQEIKWDPEYSMEMITKTAETTCELLDISGVNLIVWPEALVVLPLDAPGVLPRLQQVTQEARAPLFTGISRYVQESNGWANSSCLINENGEVLGYYDKIHLAPFGEYVPLSQLLPFVTRIVPAIGEMVPGKVPMVFDTGRRTFGPLICFEVLFPEMAARLRRNGAQSLVVITNLSWFGVSNAIPQEWQISRLRAVENRLPLIHCANTGVTGVIDPYGRDISVGETHTRTFGVFPVPTPAKRPVPLEPIVFSKMCAGTTGVLAFIVVLLYLLKRSTRNRLKGCAAKN